MSVHASIAFIYLMDCETVAGPLPGAQAKKIVPRYQVFEKRGGVRVHEVSAKQAVPSMKPVCLPG